ncbi:OmpH family outer membrane protein [Chitinophaga agrisoli]|uniref:OmpH family outer membrane protein n=1 Tax=Chitinophaga agrisoli TaxID=2607653 RepID=A0A5B2VY70_9BACT|nr:OmpH family outer membrane protein [Chitinophaga agrisoli]KAA2242979.1 OmpH family outer membrane protein [Chitinophaga agrisoli]
MRKKCTIVLLFFSLTVLTATRSHAQAKIAYINMQELILSMPEAKLAYDSLQRFEKSLNADGQTLLTELQKKMVEFNKNEPTMSASMKEIKHKELETAQVSLEQYRTHMEQQLSNREQVLTAPIIAKAKKAVADLVTEGGYACVLDNSKDIVVAANCDDLLGAAKKKLGIK